MLLSAKISDQVVRDPYPLARLKEFYKQSSEYMTDLEEKGPLYFERYVAAICDCSSPTDLVLDLGCGTGVSSCEIAKRNRRVVGSDISQLFLKSTSKSEVPGTCFVSSDVARLPFANATFDVVGAMQLIEHVWPVDSVLLEMDRVLKPDGHFVLTSPNLITPLWPLRDLPAMIFKRRFRFSLYNSYGEALTYFLRSSRLTISKLASQRETFLPREPDFERAHWGGDADAVYHSHARDIILFLRRRGYVVDYMVGSKVSLRSRVVMSVARLFGSLWTSYLLCGAKPGAVPFKNTN
jgi:ubiquinone/menaquinone biosynthesis C-methylase UbiE